MGKVQLKMPPWITSLLSGKSSNWFVLEKEIGDETTIGDLLAELTASYDDLRKAVFNPDIGKVNDQIMVFLNDNLLPESDITDTKLNDGDTIILLPVYTGG